MTSPIRPIVDRLAIEGNTRPSLADIIRETDKARQGEQGDTRPSLEELIAGEPPRRADGKPRGFRTPEQIARENAADLGQAADAAQQDTYLNRLGSMAERAATNLPGGAAALTGARYLTKQAIGEPETWAESAAANAQGAHEGGENAPGVNVPLLGRVTLADVPAGAAGLRALLRAAPGLSAAKAGGLYAGVTRAAAPQPESLGSRAVGTGLATAAGAVIPKITEGIGNSLSRLRAVVQGAQAPEYAANLNTRAATRDAVANAEYGAFRSGTPLAMTPALTKLIGGGAENEPGLAIVTHAVRTAKSVNPDLMDLPDNHPAVLVEAHKIIGDKAWRKANGFAEGRARDELLRAIEGSADLINSPGLTDAVKHYAAASREMGALQTGRKALNQNARPSGVPDKDVGVTSLDALRRNAQGRSPAEAQALREGVLGELATKPTFATSTIPGLRWLPTGFSKAVQTAPDVLRAAEGKRPLSLTDYLRDMLGAR